MNTYLAVLLVMIALFILTFLTALYIRKYDNPNLTIAFYVSMIAIIQVITNRLTIFDFGPPALEFVSPIGTYFFAFTFQMTDQINEKYGRKEVQKMIIIALLTQVFIAFMLWLVTQQPQVNDNFDANSYNTIFLGSGRIILASWITFFISENVDAFIFDWFRKKFEGRLLWLRNVVSDLVGLFVDSLIFIPLAFYGIFDLPTIIAVMTGQVITKWLFGTLDTPYIYLNRWILTTENPIIKKLVA
ncbi:MAG: queuosine precursor transporter [Candidatus Heimdallarchaeota archaeon]|nr:queuosine precursor transporter [Candidatus Heimdallarchaeota archaeon]